MSDQEKLQTLATIEGHDNTVSLLEESVLDSIVPAICTNEGCDYTSDMEPDQDAGWCEECDTTTVKSCLILAGII